MTEMFGEAWSPMSVPDLAPDDDDDDIFMIDDTFLTQNVKDEQSLGSMLARARYEDHNDQAPTDPFELYRH